MASNRYKGQTDKKSKVSKMAKVIKRYGNRKLYDTEKSAYVVLNDIAKMIRNEEDVKIIDNDTKHDITSTTLTQIIFGAEKKSSYSAPLNLLKSIIKKGDGSFSNFLSEMGLFQSSQQEEGEESTWPPSSNPSSTRGSSMSEASSSKKPHSLFSPSSPQGGSDLDTESRRQEKKEMHQQQKSIQDRVVSAVLSKTEIDQDEKTILPTSKNPNLNSDF